MCFFFFQAEDGIRDAQESRGLGDVYKRQIVNRAAETTIEQDNILMIKKLAAGRPVFVVPTMTGVDTERLLAGNIREVFYQSIPIDDILRLMETI